MQLKSPTPLGEKRVPQKDLTTEFLEVAKEKESKKRKLPKISFPTFKRFRFARKPEIEPFVPEMKEEEISTEKVPQQAPQILENKPTYTSVKEFFTIAVIPFIKTNKEKIIDISLIAVPLLLLLILFISIMSYTKAEPYRISKEFLQKIEKRDTKGAYELTTDAYQAVVTFKEFKEIANKLNSVDLSNAKTKEKRTEDRGEMGQYAYVKYKISGYYLDLVLFNDDKDWGILSIEITLIE